MRVTQFVRIPHHQIERALPLQHLGHDLAVEGHVHGFSQPAGGHAEASHRGPVGVNSELGHVGLLFHLKVHKALDVFHRGAHALRHLA